MTPLKRLEDAYMRMVERHGLGVSEEESRRIEREELAGTIAAAAADARRQAIEECARIASKAAADYRTLRDSPNFPDSRWRWAGAVEGVEAVEREIRALLPPAPEEPQP